MARPPLAKAKILDAYVALLCDEGSGPRPWTPPPPGPRSPRAGCSTTSPPRRRWPRRSSAPVRSWRRRIVN
nr:hypothetical protein [Arthrobacter sp. JCM 19049]